MNDSGRFGLAHDTDVWFKLRIDSKEGWIHTEEDLAAIGLPAVGYGLRGSRFPSAKGI